MKYVLCVLVIFLSAPSFGAISLQIGREVRYQMASNGYSIHAVYPWTFRAGYLLGRWGFFAQYAHYNDQPDGVANFNMRSSQSSTLLWVRRGIWRDWGLFAGLGAGVYQDRVQTNFAGESREDYGRLKPQLAGEIGWWTSVFSVVTFEAVAQLNVAQELQPSLVWGAGVRLGVVF